MFPNCSRNLHRQELWVGRDEEKAMPGRTRILVVDDERIIASTLATILEHQGYETATAYSGEEAVLIASSFQPDFLLSDISLGGKDGVAAAIEILDFLPQCKVLFISGHAACQDILEQARAQGFDFEILNKPVPPPELLKKISQVLSYQSTIPETGEPRKRPTSMTSDTRVTLLVS
jgi:CheY-like chemotaxis protein